MKLNTIACILLVSFLCSGVSAVSLKLGRNPIPSLGDQLHGLISSWLAAIHNDIFLFKQGSWDTITVILRQMLNIPDFFKGSGQLTPAPYRFIIIFVVLSVIGVIKDANIFASIITMIPKESNDDIKALKIAFFILLCLSGPVEFFAIILGIFTFRMFVESTLELQGITYSGIVRDNIGLFDFLLLNYTEKIYEHVYTESFFKACLLYIYLKIFSTGLRFLVTRSTSSSSFSLLSIRNDHDMDKHDIDFQRLELNPSAMPPAAQESASKISIFNIKNIICATKDLLKSLNRALQMVLKASSNFMFE